MSSFFHVFVGEMNIKTCEHLRPENFLIASRWQREADPRPTLEAIQNMFAAGDLLQFFFLNSSQFRKSFSIFSGQKPGYCEISSFRKASELGIFFAQQVRPKKSANQTCS